MITTLLSTLLMLAHALSYDVQSDAPIVTLVDELDISNRVVFNASSTHEANLRAAIAWCRAYRA